MKTAQLQKIADELDAWARHPASTEAGLIREAAAEIERLRGAIDRAGAATMLGFNRELVYGPLAEVKDWD